MIEPQTQTLDVSGATLAYDVREARSESTEPILLMIRSPMDASGFTALAGHFEHRTLVAHEPPLATVLPDREEVLAVSGDIQNTYERNGLGPAMAKFIAFTSVKGPTPPDFPNQAAKPADFGLPTEDDGSRDHPLLARLPGNP